MKILILTPFPAVPGASGGGVAVFNLIRNLSLRHEVVYLTYARADERASLSAVEPFCSDVVAVPFPGGSAVSAFGKLLYFIHRVVNNIQSFMTITPALVFKHKSGAMLRAVNSALEHHRPDIVHICFAPMAQWVTVCGNVPAVMDTQDVATVSGFRRAAISGMLLGKSYHFMQWLFWLRYEMSYYPRFAKVLTLTQQDSTALRIFQSELDVYSGAIGIDLAVDSADTGTTGRIGFLGSFAHQPNVDAVTYFVESIFPGIRARCSSAEFIIAGKNPPVFDVDGVTSIGFVDDVAAFYRSVDVVVAPLRHGGGIKVKVLETMAHGKAVVTTPVGAEGIAGHDDNAVIIAATPSDFTDDVVSLLENASSRHELGVRARSLIERRFSWQRVCDDLDKIYRAACAAKK